MECATATWARPIPRRRINRAGKPAATDSPTPRPAPAVQPQGIGGTGELVLYHGATRLRNRFEAGVTIAAMESTSAYWKPPSWPPTRMGGWHRAVHSCACSWSIVLGSTRLRDHSTPHGFIGFT